jgi:DNA (cytosine-5)-methyltransferase 1
MKILNLYAGIGGNRKLWGNEHEITAVEIDHVTAMVYKSFFPHDNVIVTDAHQYLLDHYKEFDFIWSSPPCPTHSRMILSNKTKINLKYPDMSLYQEIILLKNFCNNLFVVENVIPYYEPLIQPGAILHRHFYWCNFTISQFIETENRKHRDIVSRGGLYGFDIKNTLISDKRKALRNMVDPDLGLHILNCAQGIFNSNKQEQLELSL